MLVRFLYTLSSFPLNLVPKLLLGNRLGRKALLGSKTGNLSVTFPLPSWSLASSCIPKQELGNEKDILLAPALN